MGMSHFQQWSKASAAERRTIVQAEVRRIEEDQIKARSTEQLNEVGSTRAVLWTVLWRKDQLRISFLLRSVYDTVPSSVNLHQ